ncbi:MAG: DUF3153 domain-containing protein [Snowella sp.]|nr:DUF3153 domain-containing protein [Snowella sp.]
MSLSKPVEYYQFSMKAKKQFFSFILPLALLVMTFLSGCVRYDVGINFNEQHQGEIIQHIQLGQQLTTLSQAETDKWLASLESRAKALQGRTQRLSAQEMIVKIPFANGKELAEKFNLFFNPNPPKNTTKAKADQLDLLQLKADLAIDQKNWIFVDRNHLTLTVDLRALGVLSNQGNIIVSPGSLIDLEFALNTPIFTRSVDGETTLSPESKTRSQLVWKLKPGQINTLEAVFWVPSYLAIGTVVIIALCLGGFYLKYKRWPGVFPAASAS